MDENTDLFVQIVRQGYGLAWFLDGYPASSFEERDVRSYQERLAESVKSYSKMVPTWEKLEEVGRLLKGYKARHGMNFLQALAVLAYMSDKDRQTLYANKLEFLAKNFGDTAYVVAEAIIWCVEHRLIVPEDPLKFLYAFAKARRAIGVGNASSWQLYNKFVEQGKLPAVAEMEDQLLLDLHYSGIAGSHELGSRLVPLQTFVVGDANSWWHGARNVLAARYAEVETEALVEQFKGEENIVLKWAMYENLLNRKMPPAPMQNEQSPVSVYKLEAPTVSYEQLNEELKKLRVQ